MAAWQELVALTREPFEQRGLLAVLAKPAGLSRAELGDATARVLHLHAHGALAGSAELEMKAPAAQETWLAWQRALAPGEPLAQDARILPPHSW
mmetsp:Transcript_32752/g.58078  ORF Transcript_32752/g.58078 Transcript_32752/m.58078 type:complete len:94 (-) Transcript_32752:443-724(-)